MYILIERSSEDYEYKETPICCSSNLELLEKIKEDKEYKQKNIDGEIQPFPIGGTEEERENWFKNLPGCSYRMNSYLIIEIPEIK